MEDYYLPFKYGNVDKGTHIDFIPSNTLYHLQQQDWLDDWTGLEEAINDQLAMRDRSHAHF